VRLSSGTQTGDGSAGAKVTDEPLSASSGAAGSLSLPGGFASSALSLVAVVEWRPERQLRQSVLSKWTRQAPPEARRVSVEQS
jgi:hypothetical protein